MCYNNQYFKQGEILNNLVKEIYKKSQKEVIKNNVTEQELDHEIFVELLVSEYAKLADYYYKLGRSLNGNRVKEHFLLD